MTDALDTRLNQLTTEQLAEVSLRLTLDPSQDAILVCIRAERILESRMTEAEFAAHIAAVDALLDVRDAA